MATPLQLTAKQQALYEALNRRSQTLAKYYLGALFALDNELNPERFSQAAQSLRELFEFLPRVVGEAPFERDRKSYNEVRGELLQRWEACRGTGKKHEQGWCGEIGGSLLVLLETLDVFAAAHRSEKPSRPEKATRAIEKLDPLSTSLPKSKRVARQRVWIDLWKFLENVAHHNLEPNAILFRSKLDLIETVLASFLTVAAAENLEEIDRLLEQKPIDLTQDAKARLASLVSTHGANYRYLFRKLQGAGWLDFLKGMGLFTEPPDIEDLGNGYVTFPPWPELQYLARVAKDAPEDAIEIAKAIPATNNPRVQEDILDIALAVDDPKFSAKLLPQALRCADNKFGRWTFKKLGKLIAHWAKRGGVKAALALAERTFRLYSDPKAAEKSERLKSDPGDIITQLETRLEPEPRGDQQSYGEVLSEATKALAEVAPLETVKFLVETLDEALRFSYDEAERKSKFDGSQFWCSHLEAVDEYEFLPKNHLAHALVSSCELLQRKGPGRFAEMDSLLREKDWHIFKRVRWHVYAQFPTESSEQMCKDALEADSYGVRQFDYEFVVVLRAVSKLRLIGREEFTRIFERIETGPDIAEYLKFSKAWTGKTPSAEQVEAYKSHFLIRQFWPFKEVLTDFPGVWQRYQELVKTCREPNEESYREGTRTEVHSVVPKSPISVEDLASKPDGELIDYLNSWKPADGGGERTSVSGLSSTFAGAVRQNPDRFLQLADRLRLKEPTYVRDLLYFCSEMAQKKEQLPWGEILTLGTWVVGQAIQSITPAVEQAEDDDMAAQDWTECRSVFARILSLGAQDYPGAIPFELRGTVFDLIQNLCTKYDPRLDGAKTQGSFEKDLISQAINSVRGEAVHALVDHALWIKRHLKTAGNAEVSMKDMPEVRALLETRLDVAHEPSAAVRAVYGRLTPWLCHLDVEWFRATCGRIFSENDALKDYYLAAWNSYVNSNYADVVVFDVLKNHYRRAVERISREEAEAEDESGATNWLGHHLIRMYWLGEFPLSGTESLIEKFLERAAPKQRAHLMHNIGRSLEDSDHVPEAIKERLVAYWDCRLARAKATGNPDEFSEELCEFAWWFRSGQFEEKWCLTQVADYLSVVNKVKDEMFLVESLASCSERYPKETAQCLFLAVKQMSQDQYVCLHEDQAKQILRVALACEDADARKAASDAQDMLLRSGRFEYKSVA